MILSFNAVPVSAAIISVCSNCSYTTLQSAIDNSSSGDTINVFPGTYNENQIIINKSLNVIGNGDDTIINGGDAALSSTGLVRIVSDEDVKFSGFKLISAGGKQKLLKVFLHPLTSLFLF